MSFNATQAPYPQSAHLERLLDEVTHQARQVYSRQDQGHIAVSPYRFNPLGAHVDHQFGPVLARTIDQYTLLPFWPDPGSRRISMRVPDLWENNNTEFEAGELDGTENWIRYAQAAAAVMAAEHPTVCGLQGYVRGTLVGAGLSSSASVVLAYLSALSRSATLATSPAELVEWSRRVENDFLGLNNGIQDQMSVVYGKADALSILDNRNATASWINDPSSAADICWLVCYSGFSRELIHSGFNTRVAECREAAKQLQPDATVLGDVDRTLAASNMGALPATLARRASHFFTETARVTEGADAWRTGQWQHFGQLMNASCHSSITQYESGSQPLIDLHEIASGTSGVLGSRFSGGGYGGCLIALTDRAYQTSAAESIMESYLQRYPDRHQARVFPADNEAGVRVLPMPATS